MARQPRMLFTCALTAVVTILILYALGGGSSRRSQDSTKRFVSQSNNSRGAAQVESEVLHLFEGPSGHHGIRPELASAPHTVQDLVRNIGATDPFGTENATVELRQDQEKTAELRERGFLPWKNPNSYKSNADRGEALLCWLANPSAVKERAISPYMQTSDLEQWGWTIDQKAYDGDHVRGGFGDSPFASMSFADGVNLIVSQDTRVTVGGIEYPPSNGQYNNVFYPDLGIMWANSNHGPEFVIAKGEASVQPWRDSNGKPLPIVPLKQWSDIQYLSMQRISGFNMGNLKWVFRRIITNPITITMISQVMTKNKISGPQVTLGGTTITQAPLWPGFTIKPGQEGFNALLGAPNAAGVAWLIIQHQHDMGHKTIGSFQIFDPDTKGLSYSPTMIIELVDAPRVVYEGT